MARLLVVWLFLISLCFSSWVQSASAQPLQVGSPSPPPSTGGSTGGVEVDLGLGLEVAAEVVALTRMHLALTCYHLSVHNYARFYESVK
ncbi:hypothetical protein ERO13_D09G221201v2 [Gossypium hirsutum]|uniref:Uncharacterized protein n=2 Tax=Gossypium TaxID=3633 RepID=A0A5J5Q8T9_GOSBA|nr:hypothetical protein ES319_D09G239100v1 [Gossypium barbadense]KAG4131580.1 hypothetical protein ERO13_D09G221201v2 [Gossypium hirsutum]TYI66753.1 hypothetical protein E1A91_D09G247500v1 [Gossypium mustelinum]